MIDPSDNKRKCPPGYTTNVIIPNSCILCPNNFIKNTYGKQCIEDELNTVTCVVNRRIPKFAIQYNFKSSPVASTQSASREKGGVCHMQRLSMVNNTAAEYQDPDIDYSFQMCHGTQNSTALQCIMLAQNNLRQELKGSIAQKAARTNFVRLLQSNCTTSGFFWTGSVFPIFWGYKLIDKPVQNLGWFCNRGHIRFLLQSTQCT